MVKKYFSVLLVIALAVSVLVACSGKEESSSSQTPNESSSENQSGTSSDNITENDNKEQIDLTLYNYYNPITMEDFETYVKAPVEKEFPHITLTRVEGNAQELLTAGEFPDIVFVANSRAYSFTNMDIPVDLTRYVEKYDVDLDRFEQNNLNFIKKISDEGELVGIPLIFNKAVLYYNKDLFDAFGVEYPVDGMTWNEILELSKDFSRVIDGVQYRGIIPTNIGGMARQRSLQLIDPNTFEAKLDTDGMKQILNLTKAFYEVPGFLVDNQVPHRDTFLKEQTTAMWVDWILTRLTDDLSFEWDMVTQPTFEDRPNISIDDGATQMMLSSTSEHPDEAFQVIKFIASNEMQTTLTKRGYLTSLDDPSIRSQLFSDNPKFDGKNVAGAISTIGAERAYPTEFDGIINTKINEITAKLAEGTEDINSILRTAEEEANQMIAAERAK